MVQGRGGRGVEVIGAGLAGCEAALQCARRGVPVRLFEMRPDKMTEAHETGDVAELVCSNSLKSDEPTNAHGLLKAELRVLGSALLECAERARVLGGKALVVDRRRFSAEVQSELSRAGVSVERAEVSSLPSAAGENGDSPPEREDARCSPRFPVTVIATGPLTSQPMVDALQSLFGIERLFFYDAIAPIVSAESLDMSRIFEGSRYGAGDVEKLDVRGEMSDMGSEDTRTRTVSGYLNCPMTEEEYDRFVQALLGAELHPLHDFEQAGLGHDPNCQTIRSCPAPQFFEGCLPVEEIARRGRLALAFGPMKPVGLVDTRADRTWENWGQSLGAPASNSARDSPRFPGYVPRPQRPFAVVQLRRENAEGTMYNLVGFQTRLKQGEQERVFRMIPGLERVVFLRFGSIHRNTFLDSPRVLLPTLQSRVRPDLLVAGQLTGVEGYVESIGAGLVAGVNAARLAMGEQPLELPREMMLGSLLGYISAPRGLENAGQSRAAGTRPPSGTVPVFQPMNANFGLLPRLEKRLRGRDKRRAMAERALEAARGFALTLVEKRA